VTGVALHQAPGRFTAVDLPASVPSIVNKDTTPMPEIDGRPIEVEAKFAVENPTLSTN
jgi:hypothetical protein